MTEANDPEAKTGAPALRLLQISDTHLTPAQAGPAHARIEANFDALLAHAARTRPDLIVHTGDVTRDAPGTPAELDHARARLDALAEAAGARVLVLPGNHDVGDNPCAGKSGDGCVTSELLTAWTARFGADRFAEDIAGWRLVGLNAQLFNSGLPEEAAQWDWAETALAPHPRLALFLHKPLFRARPDEAIDIAIRYAPEPARTRLMGLIRASGARLVGTGHVHQTRSLILEGTAYAWAPAAAFVLPDEMQAPVAEPPAGRKLCAALEWRLGAQGEVSVEAVRPEGMVDQGDLAMLRALYPGHL